MIKPLVMFAVLFVNGIVCPPPLRQQAEQAQAQDQAQQHVEPPAGEHPQGQQQNGQQGEYDNSHPGYQFAYTKYLEEVVKILESDPKFTERLKNMNEEDIKAGNIADHIDDLAPEVFDKLHKAKFAEIERLRNQIEEQIKADGGAHNIKMPDHLDVQELEKFHKEDLRKLIQKTVADMNEMDDMRKKEFKEYEMKKQAEEDHKLAQLSPEERDKAQKEHEESVKRHNEHEKLKHPGSKDQLQEVWEESDHLEKESYDPKTFFALHDLNGDGFWNDFELEALFNLELDKMYNETNPDDDMNEKAEEMYRMREHVMKQIDLNQDRMISLQEFLTDANVQEAKAPKQEQEAWEDLGQQKVYTDEELQKFEKEYAQKQGWGDHAYEQQLASEQQHQQAGQQPPQAQQQVHPAQPPIQPVNVPQTPAPAAQPVQHQQPPVQQQQQQQQPPQNLPPVYHEPIQDHKKDPTYGI